MDHKSRRREFLPIKKTYLSMMSSVPCQEFIVRKHECVIIITEAFEFQAQKGFPDLTQGKNLKTLVLSRIPIFTRNEVQALFKSLLKT